MAETQTVASRKRIRKFFGKIAEVAEMPNLIEVQKESYDQFLQVRNRPAGASNEGLQAVFKSVFPITRLLRPRCSNMCATTSRSRNIDVEECQQRGMTYAAPLKVTLRLIVFDVDQEPARSRSRTSRSRTSTWATCRFMTANGTFVVNGTERVIVSQMHRSPGVFFDHDKGKTHSSGKLLFAARVIPYRGSWLDFEFDAKDIIHVRIDRRRKLPITTLLYALGLDSEKILAQFLQDRSLHADQGRLEDAVRSRSATAAKARRRPDRRQDRRGGDRGRQEDHAAPCPQDGRRGRQGPAGARRGPLRPLPRRRNGRSRRPAKSTPRPATS